MGSNVQENFQGRGNKKGQEFRFLKFAPALVLLALWISLLLNFPVKSPGIWFPTGIAAALLCSALYFLSKRRNFSFEFLLSAVIVFQGLIDFSDLPWLRLGYFPALLSLTAWHGMRTVVPLAFCIPLLDAKAFFSGNALFEAAFSVILVASAAISSWIVHSTRTEKEKAVSFVSGLRKNAKEITLGVEMESLKDEEMIAHYFAAVLKTDEEIRELLVTVKNAVMADAAYLFIPNGDRHALRCSSEEKNDLIVSGKGLILECLNNKKPFSCPDLKEASMDPGYLKKEKVRSICAAPVLEANRTTGVLAVDSARFQAFNDAEQKTVSMFAGHLSGILERERIYTKIKRSIFSVNILSEESSNLLSSLNTDTIIYEFRFFRTEFAKFSSLKSFLLKSHFRSFIAVILVSKRL